MRPTLSQAQDVFDKLKPALLPFLALVACVAAHFATPVRHSLFLGAVAWLIIFALCAGKTGIRDIIADLEKKRHLILAGCFYVFASACERAANDREGIAAPHALLPVAIYAILRLVLEYQCPSRAHATLEKVKASGFGRLLVIATSTGIVALSCSYVRFPVTALGVSATIFKACAFLLLENSFGYENDDKEDAPHTPITPSTPNGLLTKPRTQLEGFKDFDIRVVRDLACIVAPLLFLLSFSFESLRRYDMVYRPQEGPVPTTTAQLPMVKSLYNNWNVWRDLLGVVAETAKAVAMLFMVRQRGSFDFSLVAVGASLVPQVIGSHTLLSIWLSAVYTLAVILIFDDAQPISWFSSSRRRMRTRQTTTILAALSMIFLFYTIVTRPQPIIRPQSKFAPFPAEAPIEALGPLKQTDLRSHPIDQLIRSAESQFDELVKSQSQTLEQAVAEYRRRYGLPPPPKFDMWYEFAKRRNVQLIDEFDTILEQLQPFWGLEPKVIRSRVEEAIGYENMLLTVLVRNGQTVKVAGGSEWQQDATVGMMKNFVEHLPDMDLPFNIHDEPRVIVPADHLAKLVDKARTKNMPAAFATQNPRNNFSGRPADLNNGKTIKEVLTTRFNKFAHQHTWTHSRASCPADSPARSYEEVSRDNVTSYAFGDLGFVYNHTAFNDICNSPSLRETFGFFDRPNAFNIVQDLFPVFSQSKISSYQDILYPSPWYWAGKVYFDKSKDMDWEKKENELWWRGSTTGGFSRNGGWRRQHRQRVVRKINAPDRALILKNRAAELGSAEPHWTPEEVSRKDFGAIMDVKFSHVGQCDPGDCDAQKEYFEIAEKADQQDAWKYKYLLDMDGNAFSGRFYAFLLSNSLVYKMSLFQEWHKDWLKAWVHYIPLSLKGDEWLEAVRYFAGEPEGKVQAPRMAFQGQQWAKKALRNEDFEVWFFRLLLEYGRLIDDDREIIGYPGP